MIAENRKARFNYAVTDTVEAGLALTGTEVKSLRLGRANIAESYASIEGGGLYLINADIPVYPFGNIHNHAPRRKRKLLVHRKELNKLAGLTQAGGMTLVPLKMYFNDRGIAKILIGLAKGKKNVDKREDQKKRDWQRDKARLMRERG